MSLKLIIEGDIKKAMLAKDKDRLRALRAIKSMILVAETDKGATGELTEEMELKLLTRAAKQRKDSIEVFVAQGRTDLAEVEEAELKIIEEFLPQQMSKEEVTKAIQQIISEVGASTPKDMGKVMGVASKQLAGKADGKAISLIVKELLNT